MITEEPKKVDPTILEEKRNYYEDIKGITASKPSSSSSPTTKDNPPRVIIVTQMRSGSSFTGELFNRNDDFIYYFEPLIGFANPFFENRTSSNAREFIELPVKHLLQCNHKEIPEWWNSNFKLASQQCVSSRAIQSTSLCKFDDKRGIFIPASAWVPPATNIPILETACKSKRNIALKTVRVENINYLEKVVKDFSMNVKIIHLVRDPRGTHFSRLAVCKPEWILCDMPYSCARLETNIKFWLNTPKWLKNKYLLVRYEDFAENPLLIAQEIYNFVGTPMPQSVKDWLFENTQKDQGDPYSHTRNSRQTASKWRTVLEFDTVLDIQSKCHNAMEKLGYKIVDTVESLRNLNISLVQPLGKSAP